jgi:hypothetical protein
LILIIIHQISPKKSKINRYLYIHCMFPSIQFSIARFLGDPAHFTRPELPVDQFSIVKNHFINTNIAK